ncbi:Histidine kinase-, DNA gyrase B-, and HSP90-like ATPase [Paenibacillus algorifonticola]|uniref:Histidine kinase-, DNA gyrase B-, and HSP90-like ATPase n=2 Tax=Paenibacillus algorifonticola TaxID=684063 RepID=A0A1I2I957_9BACL|nr:Histidine kinase-, DNA gyrase B-, and HSP90-like ATPase [Paenibacillus algorifonticola]
MILYAKSEATGWYLIEYMPLESILSPITSSRNWFWLSLSLILLISVLSAFLLYRNVQVPIRELYLAAKRLRRGDYAVRVGSRKHDEFGYLFEQFNMMSEQIQHLINSIYAEKLRAREATLKQLQSQINPHFLYNCLFFIKNMTRIGERNAVMAMAVKLGDYYRYTTHVDQQETTLREEIKLIDNYLSIQNMRMDRIHFQIEIPDAMLELKLPRLIVQPIIENAIIHGIEPREGAGMIRVTGLIDEQGYEIVCEDDGVGLSEQELLRLRQKISSNAGLDEGCGLRNVHQRLVHKYGGASGLTLEQSTEGGLRATIRWIVLLSERE